MAGEVSVQSLTVSESIEVQGNSDRAIGLKPRSSADTAPMVWYDQQDRKIASIQVEEYTTDGEWVHRMVVSTCNADRTALIPRLSIDFGTDDPAISFTESRMRFDADGGSHLELKSPDGTYWSIGIDDDGVLFTTAASEIEVPIPPDDSLFYMVTSDGFWIETSDGLVLLLGDDPDFDDDELAFAMFTYDGDVLLTSDGDILEMFI